MLNEIIQSTEFISALIGSVIGGVVAGFFSILAVNKTHIHQNLLLEKSNEELISSLLQAIHDEIETVFERYQETMGARLESLHDGQPLNYYYPVVSDFFTVYNGNTFLIGKIKDNDLRRQIIRTYTLAKGMTDSFRLNNDLVNKLEFANKLFLETKLDSHKEQMIAHQHGLIIYADSLKKSHAQLKSEVKTLLRALQKNGVLNEK
ncbi:hypothetical protein [Methylophilus sp. YYY-1]|uniref:hypothetical protein n=1 Tax=Methylophilus sp. YYY-1 TaxID=2682087 RepID=UPI0023B3459F|nr:hypothetical protein [Methylophilus sp. YYY-1]MDF0378020.1 hypothetical protein [Methylophilus sp. YYY-1]